MHEFSLAQNLIHKCLELAARHGAQKILIVRVSIGEISGIVEDSFSFGFEILRRDHPVLAEAELEVTRTAGGDLILTQVEME